jgi:hypothetical protein
VKYTTCLGGPDFSSMEKPVDGVHSVVDRRCGGVHGGPSDSADNHVVPCHRRKARQALATGLQSSLARAGEKGEDEAKLSRGSPEHERRW